MINLRTNFGDRAPSLEGVAAVRGSTRPKLT